MISINQLGVLDRQSCYDTLFRILEVCGIWGGGTLGNGKNFVWIYACMEGNEVCR